MAQGGTHAWVSWGGVAVGLWVSGGGRGWPQTPGCRAGLLITEIPLAEAGRRAQPCQWGRKGPPTGQLAAVLVSLPLIPAIQQVLNPCLAHGWTEVSRVH